MEVMHLREQLSLEQANQQNKLYQALTDSEARYSIVFVLGKVEMATHFRLNTVYPFL